MDIHKPKPIHSWRDFIKEIGVIVLGVVIAISLEQSVEYFHRLRQLQVARHELLVELKENRNVNRYNAVQIKKIAAELEKDMAQLRAGQSSHTISGFKLDYSWEGMRPRDGAWQAARQNGALDLMPHAQLQLYTHAYEVMDSFFTALTALDTQMDAAEAIARRSPDGALSSHDIDELITATSTAQGKAIFLGKILSFEEDGLADLSKNDAEAPSAPEEK